MTSTYNFFDQLGKLKSFLSDKKTNPEILKCIRDLLIDDDIRKYFFDQLDRSDWVTPLYENGFFDLPPAKIMINDEQFRYPRWPESQYLARISAKAPREVSDIFAGLKTNNPSIIGDLVKSALEMPADNAVTLVPSVCDAVKSGTLWIYTKEASDLCVFLAENGKLDAAIKLAEALFTPKFETNQDGIELPEDYWRKEGLKKVAPPLSFGEPTYFLPVLCDWLETSIKSRNREYSDAKSDGSEFWRPAIEEHEENHNYEFSGSMVGIVRESFERAISEGAISLLDAMNIIKVYPYLVFERLNIHLVNKYADEDPKLAQSFILNREYFNNSLFKHEYAMLVGQRFDILTKNKKNEWYKWIDDGPDMEDHDEKFRNNLNQEPTDVDREKRIKWWQFEKLHLVRAHLENNRKLFYDSMLAEKGEPDMADMNVRTGSVSVPWGNVSPITTDELARGTFADAVKFIKKWQSEPNYSFRDEPSFEGLATVFKRYINERIEEYSSESKLLIDTPNIYVRGFIDEASKAVKQGKNIDLEELFVLCDWVVNRPIDEIARVDTDWQWTRDVISRLMENICTYEDSDNNQIKYTLEKYRKPIWKLIENLCKDPITETTSDDETVADPRFRNYRNLGINSSRGKAFEAALAYARWVARHKTKTSTDDSIDAVGFEEMPEFLNELEWQLEEQNRSVEVMSIIGSKIYIIYSIDKQWLENNIDKIFPIEDKNKGKHVAVGWAAWNTFIVWNRPHIEYYKIFKPKFIYIIEQIEEFKSKDQDEGESLRRLGEHLVILYGRGELKLDDDDGLLRNFLENSSFSIRRHVISFVGRTLHNSDEEIPDEIIKRFAYLWEFYWEKMGKHELGNNNAPYIFGSWVQCENFDDGWILDRLYEVVSISPLIEPEHAVAVRLTQIADIDLKKAVKILNIVMTKDDEMWRRQEWKDTALSILKKAYDNNIEVGDMKESLIDYLGRRGCLEFGKLLQLGSQ